MREGYDRRDDAGFRADARRREPHRVRRFFGDEAYGIPADPNRQAGQDTGYGPRRRDDGRLRWSPGEGEPYGELELEDENRGIDQYGPPADYAFRPETGHEFDPGYLDWRERRMAQHDRDYEAWRRERQRRYDDDYRRSRQQP